MKKYTVTLLTIIALTSSVIPVLHAVEARVPQDQTEISIRSTEHPRAKTHVRTQTKQQSVSPRTSEQKNAVGTEIYQEWPQKITLIEAEKEPEKSPQHTEQIVEDEIIEKTVAETPAAEPSETVSETTSPPITFNKTTKETEVIPVESIVAPELESYFEEVLNEIHRLTNIERKKAKIGPLEYEPLLSAIAAKHSTDMANRDYFSHSSPEGCDTGCRYKEAKYVALSWGENIGWITYFEETSAKELAEQFVDSWMDSEGHRHNILNNDFTYEGIGIAEVGDNIYVTSNFSHPW